MEQTFVMVKPDGVMRGLTGEIIGRFSEKGLKLVAARLEKIPEARVIEQYAEHKDKPFFPSLKSYIMSGPCFLMVWEGKNAVNVARNLIGATDPSVAAPGTIRGDFALEIGRNVIHGSDMEKSAQREIGIHFKSSDMVMYHTADEGLLYE